jgi:hypothetical protein
MMSVIMLSFIMLRVIMLSFIMLSVIMLSFIMLSVFVLSVIMLCVIMLCVIMLSGIMLSGIMLSVVAPHKHLQENTCINAFKRNQGLHSQHFVFFACNRWAQKARVLHYTKIKGLSVTNALVY